MRCLIIGKVWPEPSSTAAGQRTCDLLSVLSDAGWEVNFASSAQQGEHAVDLSHYRVTMHSIKVNDSAFDSWIAELHPDLVIFDRFITEEQFGWRVARNCPEALRILDTSDLHCLRMAREAQLRSGDSLHLKNETALREIAAIYRSDLTLVISAAEMKILQTEFSVPGALLAYWPFAIDLPETVVAYGDRQHFIMIGSFHHAPNLDAARWCQQAIWPKIKEKLPDAEMHLYGSYGDRYALELNQPKTGFLFKGRAKEALETMSRYRINLAPLRFGAGLKGKVFDGFQTGTPNILTPIAAEGIFEGAAWAHGSPAAFAEAAVKYYCDSDAWKQRQLAEQAVCLERFAPQDWRPRLLEMIDDARKNLKVDRTGNFIGQMLRHHHHRSVEYFSRWIEAKNKNKEKHAIIGV